MDIRQLLSPKPDLTYIAHALDGVGHEARLRAVHELGKAEMATLFDAAADADALTLDDFVPSGLDAMKEVIHHGKNSLPVFSSFQKRFCRPDGDVAEQLWGYNHQAMQPFTGPGYFVAHPWKDGGVVIDYTMLPPRHPSGWPEILPNDARLSRFIYNGTKDVMRRLSQHVTIGRAQRGENVMDNWFVLVREDVAG